jgi:hypothetical protein
MSGDDVRIRPGVLGGCFLLCSFPMACVNDGRWGCGIESCILGSGIDGYFLWMVLYVFLTMAMSVTIMKMNEGRFPCTGLPMDGW